jgi:predicted Zn-dependent protease with MMP-like domain
MRGSLTPSAVPLARTEAERFDDLVVSAIDRLERLWPPERAPIDLRDVEVVVDDVPPCPALAPGRGPVPLGHTEVGPPARLVVFRRPIEHRSGADAALDQVVREVLTDLVAELFGMASEDIDPDLE